ncbi:MAG: hypothetical protein KA715_02520 [Xanthomonadaceae bacterium]|nr:hypothetical protein [Xanthomonadaceae bacterium]
MYLITALISLAQSFSATFQNISQKEFFSQVPVVVRAVAKRSEAKWANDEKLNRKIFTYTDFEVIEELKGKTESNRITVRELGGEMDGVGLQVPGAANFESDKEYVVSLAASSDEGIYRVVSLSAGVLEVENHAGQLTVKGVLTSQNPVSYEKTRDIIKNNSKPTQEPITKKEVAQQPEKKTLEDLPPVNHSTGIWILFGIIIIGAGTWMITRKK